MYRNITIVRLLLYVCVCVFNEPRQSGHSIGHHCPLLVCLTKIRFKKKKHHHHHHHVLFFLAFSCAIAKKKRRRKKVSTTIDQQQKPQLWLPDQSKSHHYCRHFFQIFSFFFWILFLLITWIILFHICLFFYVWFFSSSISITHQKEILRYRLINLRSNLLIEFNKWMNELMQDEQKKIIINRKLIDLSICLRYEESSSSIFE